MNENKTMNLAQSLAIDSQLRLPGSAGRLLKQVRDIEQVAGDEPEWKSADLDLVASRLMVLDMQNKGNAMPLPQLLGYQQLGILPKFATFYRQGLHQALKNNDIEAGWLAGLDEGLNNGL